MSRSPHRLLSLAILLSFGLLLISACGTPSKAGVRGVAMTGGGPVDANNPPHTWPSRNVTVVAHEGEVGGPVVARVVADQAGRFSISLPPGTYTLVQAELGGQAKTITIRPGEFADVTLWQAVP